MNLLRLHEAETAILFCATREAVRRLHASLTERGFHAVALSGEHSQNERNNALQSLRDNKARVCVATDVAARGIDLPTVSLVIHVELPRDAEALQHRSGRTGRAGRKGTAVLMVPFRRRRAVDAMLRRAGSTPNGSSPRHRTRSALGTMTACSKPLRPVEFDDADRQLASQILDRLSAEDIAATLARVLRADLPAPEDILASGGANERSEPGPRAGFEGSTWFVINAGRRHNADARWLLPLICRYGHVGRNDIGAIRVANESYFEVAQRATPGFIKALRRATIAPEDSGMVMAGPPRAPDAGPAAHRRSRPHPSAKPKKRPPMAKHSR